MNVFATSRIPTKRDSVSVELNPAGEEKRTEKKDDAKEKIKDIQGKSGEKDEDERKKEELKKKKRKKEAFLKDLRCDVGVQEQMDAKKDRTCCSGVCTLDTQLPGRDRHTRNRERRKKEGERALKREIERQKR